MKTCLGLSRSRDPHQKCIAQHTDIYLRNEDHAQTRMPYLVALAKFAREIFISTSPSQVPLRLYGVCDPGPAQQLLHANHVKFVIVSLAQALFFTALHLVHLSRWAEDLIIYSSGLFKFVQCSDAYATGAACLAHSLFCRQKDILMPLWTAFTDLLISDQ